MTHVPTILSQILTRTRADVAARKLEVPFETVGAAARLMGQGRSLLRALQSKGPVGCIAEIKRKSPSAGWIRQGCDAATLARDYVAAGAAALSVLTNAPFFGGSLDDVRQVRSAVEVPILRKDFFVDAYQVAEARAAGADAVLLIMAALSDQEASHLLTVATAFGLEALVEVHNQDELERALFLPARLIGVNNRDLHNFAVDTDLVHRLRQQVPVDRVVVAESGIKTRDDVVRLAQAGVGAMLVGESLLRTPAPGAALSALLGRSALKS